MNENMVSLFLVFRRGLSGAPVNNRTHVQQRLLGLPVGNGKAWNANVINDAVEAPSSKGYLGLPAATWVYQVATGNPGIQYQFESQMITSQARALLEEKS